MYTLVEREYIDSIPHGIVCLMGVDIGGTNCNFGFFQSKESKLELLFSVHAKSQEIKNFVQLVNEVLNFIKKKYNITVSHSCFAAAGVVSPTRDYCKPTNLPFAISSAEILAHTSIHCAIIVNDFEVIGHGLAALKSQDLVLVNQGIAQEQAPRAIIGAGTGLGKCMLLWDNHLHRYMPLVSEGGHGSCSAQYQFEAELFDFIRKKEKRMQSDVSWEDVLSGRGIGCLYHFFTARDKNYDIQKDVIPKGPHPDQIFAQRHVDSYALQTFLLYTKFYARCAKNFALDTLACGGVYIAGGIAAHNLALFQEPEFMREFVNCNKHHDLLMKIPIYVIIDYNVSLYGAAIYMQLEGLCED